LPHNIFKPDVLNEFFPVDLLLGPQLLRY